MTQGGRPNASAPAPTAAPAATTSSADLIGSVFGLADKCGRMEQLKRLVDRLGLQIDLPDRTACSPTVTTAMSSSASATEARRVDHTGQHLLVRDRQVDRHPSVALQVTFQEGRGALEPATFPRVFASCTAASGGVSDRTRPVGLFHARA
jgi:hypothetical protein